MGTKEKIKRICWKTLWGFLSVVFILTNGFSLTAFAADDTEKQGTESKELTGLSIAFLNDPEPGNPLDCTAVVLSAEGVCWEIPVIWIDANGNTVYVAKEGEKYFPVFVFYMPKGYTIATMEADGRFYVKLPYYVTNLYGTDGWFFIADPALNITFITYGLQYSSTSGPAAVSQVWNAELNRRAEDAAKAEEQAVLSEHSHHHHSSSSDDDKLPVGYVDTASEEEETPEEDEPSIDTDEEIPEQVRIHCSEKLIGMVSPETLERLVDLIKNRLEPQAVNLLMNGFPAFSRADVSELSNETGLFIYLGKDTLYDGEATPEGAIAFYDVSLEYDEELGEYVQKNIMAIDASYVLQVNEVTGEWELQNSVATSAMLDNTIVHELMHGFMYDYNRYLMYEEEGVDWFIEGMASCVDNTYQYRALEWAELSEENPELLLYTEQSIIDGFVGKSEFFRLVPEESYADYISGYLATAYLGYLEYSYMYPEEVIIDENGNVDTDKIRLGLNAVLEELHNNKTLDEIIQDASGYDVNTPEFGYCDTAAFRNNFVWNYEDEEVDAASLGFCIAFLNYMEACSTEEMPAHGSLLHSNQQYYSPLDWESECESEKYRIADSGNMVSSSVDPERAWNTAGISDTGDYQELLNEVNDEEENYPEAAKLVSYDRDESVSEEAEDSEKMVAPEEEVLAEESAPEEEVLAEEPVPEEEVLAEESVPEEEALAEEPEAEGEALAEEPEAEGEALAEGPEAEEDTLEEESEAEEETLAEESASAEEETSAEESVPTEESASM